MKNDISPVNSEQKYFYKNMNLHLLKHIETRG